MKPFLSLSLLLACGCVAFGQETQPSKICDFETGDLSQLGLQKAQEDSLTLVGPGGSRSLDAPKGGTPSPR